MIDLTTETPHTESIPVIEVQTKPVSFARDFLQLTPDQLEDAIFIMENCEKTQKELADLHETHKSLQDNFSELYAQQQQAVELTDQLKAQIDALAAQVQHVSYTQRPEVEDGKAGCVPIVDVQYTTPRWVRDVLDTLMNDDTLPVVGLTGPAGIGKTHGIEQWAGQHKRRVVLLNCKGQDPFAFIESQELKDGHTTRTLGILAHAVQSSNTIIVLDELDTAPNDFQSLLLGMLEVEPYRRRITTQGNGVIPVADGVRFVITANNIGMNCSSRHRGALLPPIQNRISGCGGWIAVPMPEEKPLSSLFLMKHPTVNAEYTGAVAKAVLALIKLSADGAIDADVSIRTGLGVCRNINRFGVRGAWNLALLDGIDDPTQRASATTAISRHFPDDFRPVG
jgi:hypothetical protein